jgi:hypothetical protein
VNRSTPRIAKFIVLALLLSPAAVGAQSGLLGSLLGNLPIVGPLLSSVLFPLVGSLLSTDLLLLLDNGDDRPVRAIVRGDVAAIKTAADRDGIPVLRVLDGLVVVDLLDVDRALLARYLGKEGAARFVAWHRAQEPIASPTPVAAPATA